MDLDGDGKQDLISGNYVTDKKAGIGRVYLMKGLGEGKYAKAAELMNRAGKPVIGVPVRGTPEKPEQYDNGQICIQPFAVDWDGDGDLDLVMGNFEGSFSLIENVGTKGSMAFEEKGEFLKCDDEALKVPGHHGAPFVTDWDGDGDLDLLSGSSDGAVYLSINSGSRKEPELTKFKAITKPYKGEWEQILEAGEEPKPSGNVRIWVADVNGDGKADLLTGDRVTIQRKKASHSSDESQKEGATHPARLKEIRTGFVWLHLAK